MKMKKTVVIVEIIIVTVEWGSEAPDMQPCSNVYKGFMKNIKI